MVPIIIVRIVKRSVYQMQGTKVKLNRPLYYFISLSCFSFMQARSSTTAKRKNAGSAKTKIKVVKSSDIKQMLMGGVSKKRADVSIVS